MGEKRSDQFKREFFRRSTGRSEATENLTSLTIVERFFTINLKKKYMYVCMYQFSPVVRTSQFLSNNIKLKIRILWSEILEKFFAKDPKQCQRLGKGSSKNYEQSFSR